MGAFIRTKKARQALAGHMLGTPLGAFICQKRQANRWLGNKYAGFRAELRGVL